MPLATPSSDPLDFSDKYNTPIAPDKQVQYSQWARAQGQDPVKGKYDYDLQGAFLASSGTGGNGHFTDQFKKPNHPTFSDESQYHGLDGYVGGKWTDQGYQPSSSNLQFRSQPELQQYFNKVEPDTKLLPAQPTPAPTGSGGVYTISDLAGTPPPYRARPPASAPTPSDVVPAIRRIYGQP